MSGWSEGYVTDIAYGAGYYRLQSPAILSLACILNRVAAIDPAADEPLSFLELGCGVGYTATVLAACNPAWQVTGVDFNPGHIAAARQLAGEAGLTNIRFIEANLAEFEDDPQVGAIPEADVVSLHGVWSWVTPSVRRGILRLLRAKVRAGGIVHVSYYVLPAWQSAIGLQRVIRDAGRRMATRSDRQAQAGVKFAQSLREAEAVQITNYQFVTTMLDRLSQSSGAYLAHEFMNESWSPSFHADVVADFAEAKLDWAGSASLTDNFDQLTLHDAQRALADAQDDPIMVELIKDMCMSRGLRQDVFVRGARRIGTAERDTLLGEVTLALTRLPEHFDYEAEINIGKATLEAAFYRPVVAALHERPRRVRELLALPDLVGKRDNPAELVAMLVATDQAIPVTPRAAAPDEPGTRLNRAVVRRRLEPIAAGARFALASSRLGAALNAGELEMFVFDRLQPDPDAVDPDAWVAEIAAGRENGERDRLRDMLGRIVEQRVPVWRRFGIL